MFELPAKAFVYGLDSLQKEAAVHLILGGAAVHRCGDSYQVIALAMT
jgi:hypothetical protein